VGYGFHAMLATLQMVVNWSSHLRVERRQPQGTENETPDVWHNWQNWGGLPYGTRLSR
jgi:hypothetical protein